MRKNSLFVGFLIFVFGFTVISCEGAVTTSTSSSNPGNNTSNPGNNSNNPSGGTSSGTSIRAPTNLRIQSSTNSTVTLTWSGIQNHDWYVVECIPENTWPTTTRVNYKDNTSNIQRQVTINLPRSIADGITTTYWTFRVKAVQDSRESAWSNTVLHTER